MWHRYNDAPSLYSICFHVNGVSFCPCWLFVCFKEVVVVPSPTLLLPTFCPTLSFLILSIHSLYFPTLVTLLNLSSK